MQTGSDFPPAPAAGHLQAGQLATANTVVYAGRLHLRRFTVQVSVVKGLHFTLLIAQPRPDFLPAHGPGQVLALRAATGGQLIKLSH